MDDTLATISRKCSELDCDVGVIGKKRVEFVGPSRLVPLRGRQLPRQIRTLELCLQPIPAATSEKVSPKTSNASGFPLGHEVSFPNG
jgi:hypothetical protein